MLNNLFRPLTTARPSGGIKISRATQRALLRGVLIASALVSGICEPILANAASETTLESQVTSAPTSDLPVEGADILVIHSYHPNLSWTRALQAGIEQGFHPGITIHHEYLDAKRHPTLIHQEEFLKHIQKKYENIEFSALMITDDPGTDLVLANRDEYFSGIPTVFMGVNNVQEELLNKPWLTGVFETHSDVETIVEAARQNSADSVIVLSDSTSTGQRTLQRIQDGLAEESNPPQLIVIDDLVTTEIASKLGPYPDNWPIFLAGQLREGNEERALVPFEQEALILQAHVPNPSYANSVARIGYGTVGGKLLDGQYHAQQAVELAQQILTGTPAGEIEPILQAKNQWMFDAQAIESADIDERKLPADSVLINVKPTFYSQYRNLVWGLAFLFSCGIITITVLSYAIRRQKQAERLLKEHEQQLENRVEQRTTELSQTLEKLQQTQAQLIQTEKMSSLGQLVGGVAHELNNPLSFFSGNVTCLERYFQDVFGLVQLYEQAFEPSSEILAHKEDVDIDYLEKDIPLVFESIRGGANRIQKIVSGLQAFSRADEVGEKSTDINQSLESTFNILNTQIPQDIEVHKNYGTLPKITCNPGEMNQVFLSILVNSIEAMKAEETRLKQLFISTLTYSDTSIRVSIKDTGPGIPEQIQTKVFDPFFTTKPVGEGTGLGLSLAYQTINKHQGKISLRSDGRSGTEFIIDLPIERCVAASSTP